MGETELENLVVRLTGNSVEYTKMMTDAAATSQQTASQVEMATKRIEAMGVGLKSFAGQALGVLAGFGVATSLSGAFDKFVAFEKVTLRLNAAIESNGRNVKEAMDDYNAFAKTIADSTLTTKGATLSMLKQAEAAGFYGDAAKRVVTNAVALAGATGGSAEDQVRSTIALEQGNAHLLKRALNLRGVTNEAELLTKIQQKLTSGLKVAEAESQSTGGQIEKLKRSLAGLNVEIGGMVATAIRPLVEGLTSAVSWFNALDPTIKQATIAVAGIMVAIVSIGPVLSMLAPLLSVLGTVVGVVFSPWIVLIGAVVLALTVVVESLGGLSAAWEATKGAVLSAWDWAKQKTNEFIAWVKPVTDAMYSLFSTVWGKTKKAAADLWEWFTGALAQVQDFASGVWQSIAGDASVSWEDVRDAAQTALIAVEWSLSNVGAIASYVWAGAKLYFIQFADTVIHFFQNQLPAIASWFASEWSFLLQDVFTYSGKIFSQLGDNIGRVFERVIPWLIDSFKLGFTVLLSMGENLTGNLIRLFQNLPALVKGKVKFEDIWKPLTEGLDLEMKKLNLGDAWKPINAEFERTTKKLNLPERDIGALEKQLREDFENQGAALGTSFADFKAAKLKEFMSDAQLEDLEKSAGDKGLKVGEVFSKHAEKGMAKFDVALAGSAEAITRLAEYQASLEKDKGGAQQGPQRFDVTQTGGAEAKQRETQQTEILKEIRDGIRDGNKKPGIEIEPAGI